MGTVFLSYKTEDRLRAERLVHALHNAGLKVWWDQNLGAGDTWRQQLTERLDAAACVLVLWSERSVGPEGNFVQDEAARAQRRGTYLPILIDHVEMPLGFGAVQAHDLIGWKGSLHDARLQALLARVHTMLATRADPSAAGIASASGATRPAAGPPMGRRTLLLAGSAVLGTAGLAALVPTLRTRLGRRSAAPGTKVTLAVLPFRPLATGEQGELLAEGLTEELRTALARSGLIQVAARTSANSFAGSDLGTREIARRLGVEWLLAGSVRVGDARARVSAALAEAETGLETWNDSFDHAMDDLIAMQQRIATSVATALVGTLGPEAAAATGRVPTNDAQAYGAYLRGRRLLDEATDASTDRAALAEFDAALARDGAFARAHAARARALQAIANASLSHQDRLSLVAEALAAAQRAVALEPDDAIAQSTLGFVQMYGLLDFPAARDPFEAAYRLAPTDADILIRHGLFHARVGTMATGLRSLAEATRRDPYNPRAFRTHGFALLAARRHPESIAEINKGLALNPALSAAQATIGDNLLALGDAAGALAAYEREVQDFSRLTGLAIARQRLGNQREAEEAFQALTALGDEVAYQQAQVLAQWGRPADAMQALSLALRLRDAGVPLMRNDPFLDPLRSQPAFQAMIKALAFA